MPVLLNGQLFDKDRWLRLEDDVELPQDASHCIVSLSRFLEINAPAVKTPVDKASEIKATELAANASANGSNISSIKFPGGVVLSPSDSVSLLAPYSKQLPLICIDFPVYTDGRGYSHARLLRKRQNYTGELRALGDIRPEQMLFMARTGINSFQFDCHPDVSLIKKLASQYTTSYQSSYPLPAV